MAKGGVVTNGRTMWYDLGSTLASIIEDIDSRGYAINMTRTFRLYGLKFNDERSFTSRYRGVFGLSKDKAMWDITLREMVRYRDLLVGDSVGGYGAYD